MNRPAAEPRIQEDSPAEIKPIGGVNLNGTAQNGTPVSRAADGHALIHVNGLTVDPRTIEGLVAYHIGKQYKGPSRRAAMSRSARAARRGRWTARSRTAPARTTCFYVITGLIRADAGAIYLDGEEVTDLPMYQRARGGIGYLRRRRLRSSAACRSKTIS